MQILHAIDVASISIPAYFDARLKAPVQFEICPLSAEVSMEELTELLHRSYARLGSLGLNFTAVDQSAITTAARIRNGQCFVAFSNGRLAGTVLGHPPDPHSECPHYRSAGTASLRQFAVDPDLQGMGIGHALASRCEAWARDSGHLNLALDTAEPATHLRDFYLRLGYEAVGFVQWAGKNYRSVVMRKSPG